MFPNIIAVSGGGHSSGGSGGRGLPFRQSNHIAGKAALLAVRLYRQLSIAAPTRQRLQTSLDVRPHNGDVTRKLAYGDEEVAEEDEQTVQLDEEAGERPAQQDEKNSGREGDSPLDLLTTGEECDGLLPTDYEREADQEKDLCGVWALAGCLGVEFRGRVWGVGIGTFPIASLDMLLEVVWSRLGMEWETYSERSKNMSTPPKRKRAPKISVNRWVWLGMGRRA